MGPGQAMQELGLQEHTIRFTANIIIEDEGGAMSTANHIHRLLLKYVY